MTTMTGTTHPKTGLPVQEAPTFQVGDLVTESFLGDSTPGVVVAVTPKTVYVASVEFALGNVSADDVPGYNGYGDSATLVVDPESVEQALRRGKSGARKYVLRVSPKPAVAYSLSLAEREMFPQGYHRARWAIPGSQAGGLHMGARYRRDPHV